MCNAEPVKRGEEDFRRFDALHRGGVIAENGPAFNDQPEQIGPVLEACAIDEAEYGRGGALGQRFTRAQQALGAEAALDAPAQLAAGISRLLRIGVREEIDGEWDETRPACRLHKRSRRNRRDE